MNTINAEEQAKKIEAGFEPRLVSLIKEAKELATFYNMNVEQVIYLQEVRALDRIGTSIMIAGGANVLPSLLKSRNGSPSACSNCNSKPTSNSKPWPLPGEEE